MSIQLFADKLRGLGASQQRTVLRPPTGTLSAAATRPRLFNYECTETDQPADATALSASAAQVPALDVATELNTADQSEIINRTRTPRRQQPAHSDREKREDYVEIKETTDCGKAARYLLVSLERVPPGTPVVVQAVDDHATYLAVMQAVKTICRASEMIADNKVSTRLVFQPQLPPPANSSRGKDTYGPGTQFHVWQHKENSAAKSPQVQRKPGRPLLIRPDTDPDKISKHCLLRVLQAYGSDKIAYPVAEFVAAGEQPIARVTAAIDGFLKARKDLGFIGKADIAFSVRKEAYGTSGQRPSSAAAAGEAESSSSSTDYATPASKAVTYIFKAFLHNKQSGAAGRARHSSSSSSSSSGSSSHRSAGTGVRTGVAAAAHADSDIVVVTASEWADIQQQLAAVPQLTEQLQVMTQQHQQLVGLLAAQQQQLQQLQQQ